MDGVYDEKAAQESFQEALKEWRGEDNNTEKSKSSNSNTVSTPNKIAGNFFPNRDIIRKFDFGLYFFYQ